MGIICSRNENGEFVLVLIFLGGGDLIVSGDQKVLYPSVSGVFIGKKNSAGWDGKDEKACVRAVCT